MQPCGCVQPLDVAGRNEVIIGTSLNDRLFRTDHFWRRIAMLVTIFMPEDFDDLSIVHIRAPCRFYSVAIGSEAIGRHLNTIAHP